MRFCSSSSSSAPEFELTDQILDAELAKNHKLAVFEKSKIKSIHETFLRAGFTSENAFKVLKKYPPIIRHSPKKLENTMECWRGLKFTNSQYIQLFVQCPELLEFDNENVLRSRITDIKSFAERTKNIWRLLMASPDILIDSPKIIEAKADYLLDAMKVDVSDAVKSGVFSHTLQKLKCRHMLLVRLGIYKEKSKHDKPLDANKNPRISRIIDTSDSEFAKKICGISIDELNAFYALYRRELEQNRIDDEEQDDESLTDVEDDADNDSDDEVDPMEKHGYDSRAKNRYNKVAKKPKVKTW